MNVSPKKQQTLQYNQQKYYKIKLQLHGQYEAKNRQPQQKNYVQWGERGRDLLVPAIAETKHHVH